ncbi:Rpb7-binding protein seb1 [Rhypophila sp. PSN 637]
MSSVVGELEASLQGMLALRPPGVSGSRIANITALFVANVQSESVLIQKLYTHFKRAPGTHKLGVLYVVDSVAREWMKKANAHGQPITTAAQDGTFAAGVNRVTELMPILMNDIVASAPEDQKVPKTGQSCLLWLLLSPHSTNSHPRPHSPIVVFVASLEKISKLVDIWEKAQTFPTAMVNSFKEKLSAQRPNESTTPPGSPPPNLLASLGVGSKPAATQAPPMPNILETLANIARQNAANSAQSNPSVPAPAPAAAPAAASTPAYTSSGPYSNGVIPPTQMPVPAQPGMPYLPTTQPAVQPVNLPPALPFAFLPPAQGAPAPQIAAPGALDAASNPAIQLVAALAAQGMAIDKIAAVVQQFMGQGGSVPGAAPQAPQPQYNGYAGAPAVAPAAVGAGWDAPRPDDLRDRNGYHDSMRSPGRPRGRSRSRSPRRWEPRSPMSRGNDRGGEFGRNMSPGRGRHDDRDRERDRDRGRMADYRQRSPQPRRGLSPPSRDAYTQEKWVEFDPNLPSGCIKVYSRTLFVGGVTCSEEELNSIFGQFGEVQSTIVHKEKRHAFVKMFFRKDAEAAKAAMEGNRNTGLQLRTRWGVGFGPRDCSDYQTGISIIPIHKLTEADRKWMLTAAYGGSGGRPIAQGLCVEEPDIEIGAGVSSKAISRRMQTDKGGNHGPKSSRTGDDFPHEGPGGGGGGGRGGGGGDRGGRRWGGRDKHRNSTDGRRDDRSDKGQANNDEPIVMGLPAGFTVGRNGINVPPNFAFSPSQ